MIKILAPYFVALRLFLATDAALTTSTVVVVVASQATAKASTNSIIICDGDSLTSGTGGSAGSNYVAQMNLTALWGSYVTNIGHAGDLITTNTSAFDTLRNLTNATAYSKRTVVFMMMINDLAGNDSVANVTTNYNAWADNVKGAFPDVKIMAITQFDANVSGTITGRVMEVNAWLRTNTTRFDYIADAALDSRLDDHTDTTYFDADGVHLKDAGYAVLAGIVASNLVYQRRTVIDYYVRKDGSDSNRGFTNTAAGAKLTIQAAANGSMWGDTITVNDGTYQEVVTTTNPGSNATQRIRFQGATTNAAVAAWIVTQPFVSIAGFTITGNTNVLDDGSIRIRASDLLCESNNFEAGAVSIAQIGFDYARTNNRAYIAHCKFWNGWGHSVTLVGYGGSHTVTNCYFTSTNGNDAFRIASTNNLIVGNTFTNWSNHGLSNGMVLKVGVNYYFSSTNGTPSDFSNVGGSAWPYTLGETYGGNAGFTATGTTPNAWGGTVMLNGNHPDIIQAFQNGASTTGYPAFASWDNTFERNYIINCYDGCQIGNISDDGNYRNIRSWTFRNNLYVRISNTMNLAAPDFSFFNNTFYQCASNSGQVISGGASSAGTATNMTIYNNIFYACGSDPASANKGWYNSPDTTNGLKADYNLVFGTTGSPTKDSDFGRLGTETHGINGTDPLLSSTTYKPATNSPALNIGTNLLAYFTTDLEGVARDSTPALGAFEVGADSTSAARASTLFQGAIRAQGSVIFR